MVDLLALCPSLPAHQENVRLKAVACGCLLNVANQNGRTIIKDLQLCIELMESSAAVIYMNIYTCMPESLLSSNISHSLAF